MKNNNHSDLQRSAQNHRTPPRPELWDRIETKLDARSDQKRSSIYLKYAVAAMLIAVLSTTLLFSNFLNSDLEKSSPYFVSVDLEDHSPSSPIYTIEQVRAFKKAYNAVN